MMSDPKDGADKMSDAPQLVYCPKDHEYAVRCGKESCENTTSMKRLLETCPLDVKEELHHHLGELIANEKSTKVVHRTNKVQLLAACSNTSTNTLMKVVEHRPYEIGDRLAQGSIIAGDTKFEKIDGLLAAVDSLITDTEANPSRPRESEGDRNTRLFISRASDLLSGGQCKDYPLKFYTDALVLDRFFNHMNDNCQSFTQAQCDHFKETILPLYEQKAIQYGLPS